ncbi:MAG: VTT domain-containing protein [Chloroflexota bacterium]
MLLAGLLIGGGALYLGARIYQQSRTPQTLVKCLYKKEAVAQSGHHSDAKAVPFMWIGGGVVVAGSLLWLASTHGITPLFITNQLISFLRTSPYSPVLYLAAYTVLPLFLFPASLLTVASGLLYGPVVGFAYALAGAALSALAAYGIGYQLRNSRDQGTRTEANDVQKWQTIEPYIEEMQEHPFTSMTIIHLLLLPYNLVNYGAGALGLNWRPFLLGTMLGSLPGTLAFVLSGASIQGLIIRGLPRLNLTTLTASGLIFAGSVTIARYLATTRTELKQAPVTMKLEDREFTSP